MLFKRTGKHLPKKRRELTKMLRVMKLTAILLTIVALQVSAGGNAQSVTLDLHNATLEKVFKEIHKQTGYSFFYEKGVLQNKDKISVQVKDAGIEEALNKCFRNLHLDFSIVDKTIVIKEQPTVATEMKKEIPPPAFTEISGVVKDAKGNPLASVSIVVRGTKKGTSTNTDGSFTIDAKEGDILEISAIGYKKLNVAIGKGSNISIVMELEIAEGTDMVVVGYGSKKKANLTGAVSSVKMNDVLGNRPATTTGSLLQGVVPGLQILTSTGEPGAGFSFNIRGTNSINGGSPLILVDNVPINSPLNQIDPNEIESVTVLKDAGSAAIYGARAAFGVVLITTKKAGRDQKMQLSYNNSFAFSFPGKLPAKATPLQTVQSYKDMGYTAYWTGQDIDTWLGLLNNYQQNPRAYPSGYTIVGGNRYQLKQTDVLKDIMSGNAFQQNHNFSVSGGSAKSAYRVSFGTSDNDGILVTNKDSYNRKNIRAFLSTDVTPWLTTQLDASYSKATKSLGNTSGFSNYFAFATSLPSYFPTDTVTINGVTLPTQAPKNVLNHVVPTKDRNDDIRLYGKAIAKPLKGLTLVGEYTYDRLNNVYTYYDKRFAYNNGSTFNPDQTAPFSTYQKYNAFTDYFATNIYGTYEKSLNNVHNFTAMAGFNQERSYFEFLNATKGEMINDNLPSISQSTGTLVTTDGFSEFAVRGYFGRISYNYKSKYLFEADGRYDGSSRFPEAGRWGFFPSFSAGWRISQEQFFKNIAPFISDLKIRGSWGAIGNQVILKTDINGNRVQDYYPYIPGMAAYLTGWASNNLRTRSLATPGLVSNDFTWEKVETLDFGVDMGLFKNRFSLVFDWYRRNTKNMLTQGIELPAVLGTAAPLQNAADLRSKGWEIQVEWKDRIGKNLSYRIGANLYDFQAIITKFKNDAGLLNNYYEGMRIGEIWGYTTDRLYTVDDFEPGSLKPDLTGGKLKGGIAKVEGSNPNPGDVLYIDMNKDGIIKPGLGTLADHGDISIIGNSSRRYEFGVNGGATWKNFDLSFFINGVGKRDLWLATDFTFPYNQEFNTIYTNTLDYWTAQNTNAHYFRIYQRAAGNTGFNKRVQKRYLLNGAYLRIKNITLSYSLPKQLIRKAKLNNVQVFFSGENLFTFDHLPIGLDPEYENKGNGSFYPFMKMYSFGINVNL
jgi:TonB-linked SusC/RagA family outer membrane protein